MLNGKGSHVELSSRSCAAGTIACMRTPSPCARCPRHVPPFACCHSDYDWTSYSFLWTPVTCLLSNVTYSYRVDQPGRLDCTRLPNAVGCCRRRGAAGGHAAATCRRHPPSSSPTPKQEQTASTTARCRSEATTPSCLPRSPCWPAPAPSESWRSSGCYWQVSGQWAGELQRLQCLQRHAAGWQGMAAPVCCCRRPRRQTLACPLGAPCGAGGALGAGSYWLNLRELGNGVALWLGISPPDLFFYAVSERVEERSDRAGRGDAVGYSVPTPRPDTACVRPPPPCPPPPQFIPPLALDSALRLDFFLFRKVG